MVLVLVFCGYNIWYIQLYMGWEIFSNLSDADLVFEVVIYINPVFQTAVLGLEEHFATLLTPFLRTQALATKNGFP